MKGVSSSSTVAVLEITKGKVTVTRGGIAPRVLGDIEDVAGMRPKIKHATVRISRSRGKAEIELKGELSKEQRQKLRNVIGNVPLQKLTRKR